MIEIGIGCLTVSEKQLGKTNHTLTAAFLLTVISIACFLQERFAVA